MTWRLNVMQDPGEVPGKERNIRKEIWMKRGLPLIIRYLQLFVSCDKCIMLMWDINNRGNLIETTWGFSYSCLHFFKSKTMLKCNFIWKINTKILFNFFVNMCVEEVWKLFWSITHFITVIEELSGKIL